MSHKATNWAVEQRGLKPATKIVLWHLADCHNAHTGQCNPKQSTLADKCEMSRSTVNLHLDKLCQLGLIKRVASVDPKTRRQRPTHYLLALDGALENEDPCPKPEHGAVSENQTDPCPKNDQSRVRKSDTKNPVREPGKEPIGFSEFWKIVPVKVSKQDALEAWKRLSAGDRELAARHVVAFYDWFRKTYPSANPLHPVRYLSKKRWEDVAGAMGTETVVNIEAIRAGLNSRVPSVRDHARQLAKRHGINLEAAE